MTTTTILEGLEPLAAWDARDPAWACGPWYERGKWVDEHLGHATHTYRVELYLLDAPFAVVHRYAGGRGDGCKYNGPDGKIATEPPVIVPLTDLPPAHLMAG